MERLTRRYFEDNEVEPYVYGGIRNYGDSYGGEAIDKLAEYEDLEEQGLLIKLPCKVGDTVSYTDRYSSFEFIVDRITFGTDHNRIWAKEKGCIVYLEDFDKYCK